MKNRQKIRGLSNRTRFRMNTFLERISLFRIRTRLYCGDATYVLSMPAQVQIGITTRCNLSCRFCENLLLVKAGMAKDMELSEYCRLIDQLKGVATLSLLGIGEPLLHPDFPKMVHYAAVKDWGWKVSTTTNGMLLSEEMADRLIDAGLMEMRFSLDSPNSELLESMRKGANFKQITENIRRFRRKTNMKLGMNVVMTSLNMESLRGLVPFASDLGVDHLQVATLKPWTGVALGRQEFTLFKHIDQEQLDVINKIHADAAGVRLEVSVSYEPYYGNFCRDPWNKPYIDPNGGVAPCCTWTANLLENAFEVGFWKAWNGPRIRHLRRLMLEGFPGSFCYDNCRLVRQSKSAIAGQDSRKTTSLRPSVV